MRQNRDCRSIFAAAAAVKCYSIQLVDQMLSFAAKSRLSRYFRGGGGNWVKTCAFTSTDIINSWCWKKDFTMTNGNKILERIGGIVCDDRLIVMNRAAPSLEEADNRLLLHVKEAVMRGRTNVIVRTVDSDIIVIILGFLKSILVLP